MLPAALPEPDGPVNPNDEEAPALLRPPTSDRRGSPLLLLKPDRLVKLLDVEQTALLEPECGIELRDIVRAALPEPERVPFPLDVDPLGAFCSCFSDPSSSDSTKMLFS